MNKHYLIVCFCVILLTGAALRLFKPSQRPMHTDEAVHAVKFSEMLEGRPYEYDPQDYHGPILYYLSLLESRAAGIDGYNQLSEAHLRFVPAAAGILLIVLAFFIGRTAGKTEAILCSALAALSPGMLFYSRYYIQEIPLVLFTFSAIYFGWKFTQTKRYSWIFLSGTCTGLMIITKETWILAAAAAVIAYLLINFKKIKSEIKNYGVKWVIFFILPAVFVPAFFFSTFFTKPAVLLSVFDLSPYLGKAFSHDWHLHPWYFYIKIILIAELPVVIILIAGIRPDSWDTLIKPKNSLIFFCLIFSAVLELIYTIISYKTPWCLLSFYFGAILLAGFLAARALRGGTVIRRSVIAAGFLMLVLFSAVLNFYKYCAPDNPYVYAHTAEDVYDITEIVNEAAKVINGENTRIDVIVARNDYWPLPWYLRKYPLIGWHSSSETLESVGDIVIIQSDMSDALAQTLYSLEKPGEKSLWMLCTKEPLQLRHGLYCDIYTKYSTYQKLNLPPRD
jgi:uncharacterized protein (TIGR03663 family)